MLINLNLLIQEIYRKKKILLVSEPCILVCSNNACHVRTAAPQREALSPRPDRPEHQAGPGLRGPPPGVSPSQSRRREAAPAPWSGANFPSLRFQAVVGSAPRALLWPLISFSTETKSQHQKAPTWHRSPARAVGWQGTTDYLPTYASSGPWSGSLPLCSMLEFLVTSQLSPLSISSRHGAPQQHLALANATVTSGWTLPTTDQQHAPLDCPWEVNKYLLYLGNCNLGACVLQKLELAP